MKYKLRFALFFSGMILFQMAANFAHPVTPTIIQDLALPDYMFGLMLASTLLAMFLFSPFWGKINNMVSTRTILLMSAIRMFDCYRDVPLTFKKVGSIFTTFNWNVLYDGSLLKIGLTMADYWVLLAGLAIVFGVSLYKYRSGKSVRDGLYAKHQTLFYALMGALFVLVLIFGAYGIGFDSSKFIYSQF